MVRSGNAVYPTADGGDMSTGDKISNKAEETKGSVKKNVGDATGNDDMAAEGRSDESKGRAKQAGENVKDAAKNAKDAVTPD
jgi:uncharacterized protein YjbJ (UPF0337 family)